MAIFNLLGTNDDDGDDIDDDDDDNDHNNNNKQHHQHHHHHQQQHSWHVCCTNISFIIPILTNFISILRTIMFIIFFSISRITIFVIVAKNILGLGMNVLVVALIMKIAVMPTYKNYEKQYKWLINLLSGAFKRSNESNVYLMDVNDFSYKMSYTVFVPSVVSWFLKTITLWSFSIAMENGALTDDFPS